MYNNTWGEPATHARGISYTSRRSEGLQIGAQNAAEREGLAIGRVAALEGTALGAGALRQLVLGLLADVVALLLPRVACV